MYSRALKKFSPIGLLALAILAGIVAVSTHKSPNKDADFNVIGYFFCVHDEEIESPLSFVLVRDGTSYKKLIYDGDPSMGKPTDLTYFSEFPLAWTHESAIEFRFGKTGSEYFVLNRMLAFLTSDDGIYWCKYGDQGKRLVWRSVMDIYRTKKRYMPINPLF